MAKWLELGYGETLCWLARPATFSPEPLLARGKDETPIFLVKIVWQTGFRYVKWQLYKESFMSSADASQPSALNPQNSRRR